LDIPLERLNAISHIPAEVFAAHTQWGTSVTQVPMHHFAAPYGGVITLSHEHTAVRWLARKTIPPHWRTASRRSLPCGSRRARSQRRWKNDWKERRPCDDHPCHDF
jgi:hypothetical protein